MENILSYISRGVVTYLRQLEAAGTQIRGGSSLQKLNIQIGLDMLLQIHTPLLQKSLYAMEHAVYLLSSPVLGCLKHAGQAGINHRGGAPDCPTITLPLASVIEIPPFKIVSAYKLLLF